MTQELEVQSSTFSITVKKLDFIHLLLLCPVTVRVSGRLLQNQTLNSTTESKRRWAHGESRTTNLWKQFSSVQDGIYALRKAHMRSTPSLRSFPNVALETVPMLV